MNDYNFDDIDTFRNGFKNSKLKDFFSRQSMDSDQETHDYPDLDFNYADTDTPTNEIAELYSYTEQPEFQLNVKAFEDYMEMLKLKPCWKRLTCSEKSDVIITLLDQLDVLDKNIRLKCARCFLYLVQGCWAECQSDIEQQALAKENVLLLYKHGVFANFMELFYAESNVTSVAIQRKVSVNINDSTELRVILSIIYIFIEIIRTITNDDYAENVAIREECKTELQSPIEDELLLVKLFGMLTHFCVGNAPHYPIKKVLLLIWKTLLFTLGDTNELRRLKAEKRREAGLDSYEEDTLQVVKTMRACSPPSGGGEMFESHQKRTNRQLRKSLIKQSSLDESLSIDYEGVPMDDDDYDEQQMNSNNASVSAENKDDNNDATLDENNANINDSSDAGGGEVANYEEGGDNGDGIGNGNRTANESAVSVATSDDLNTTSTLMQAATTRVRSIEKVPSLQQSNKRLPWVPKIRNKDLDLFLDHVRLKFIGYLLPNDRDTVIGLPQPICEGVKVLKRYVYVSLSEVQMEKEENINKYPISQGEKEIPETAAEIVYRNLLPIMQKSIIALLKVLLAAAPTSKTKTDTLNIMADVLPEEMPMTVLQSMKLGTDVNRHKEIIVKAVSAILLLLLKHFKMNHIYQFEFLSQYLVFANCIPLILKFFNQNISAYVGAKNVIPILDFPACVIGDQPELTSESLEIGDNQQCSWRNVFACINLLRVLTKVTKWKHSRIMMLVVFKSSPILRRTLKVRHPMMQLYILKLLKMQTKYLGRQWRKSNMKMMSAIYQKVRHRLHDDWAFGNDVDARPWDFQIEECSLRNAVDRFNNRRYFTHTADSEFTPLDVHITSLLSSQVDLTDEFKKHYYLWVQQEVFDKTINWDELVCENWI